jgi:hypothetical protein
MPELKIKDVRLPELHLPEMSRGDIVQAVSGARRDIDLSRFDPRKVELPDVELKNIDPRKAITEAAQAAGLVKAPRRQRLPFIVGGLITLGLVGVAIMNSPAIRQRLAEAAQRVKARIDERRAERLGRDLEAHAFDAAVAVPVETSPYADTAPSSGSPFDGPSDLPPGFGADVQHDGPLEERANV